MGDSGDFDPEEGLVSAVGGDRFACGVLLFVTELLFRLLPSTLLMLLLPDFVRACLRHAVAAAVVTLPLNRVGPKLGLQRYPGLTPKWSPTMANNVEAGEGGTMRDLEVIVLCGDMVPSSCLVGRPGRKVSRGRGWSTTERRRNAPTEELTLRLIIFAASTWRLHEAGGQHADVATI